MQVTISMTEEEARRYFSTMPKLYTVEEIAKEYHCSLQYIRDEIKAKKLKAIMLAGCLQCPAADVQDWIEVKKQESINKATGGNAEKQ